MDESRERWLSYLEMDECNLFGDMNSLVEVLKGESSVQPEQLSCKSHPSDSNFTKEGTTLLRNPIGNSSSLEENAGFDNCTSLKQHASPDKPFSSMSYTLSFEDPMALPYIVKKAYQYHGEHSKETQKEPNNNRKSKRSRSSSQIQDHIMNERKRRENITKLFIALSAIIPGLKKVDKASVLVNAIDYVKYLQKRVKDLEEESKKRKIESAVSFKVNKSHVKTVAADDFSCTPDGLDRPINICPKVEARVSGKDVLIRVMCDKQKDIVPKLLGKLEAHDLSIVCSNVLPFGNSALNITCIAQMDHEFSMTMGDLAEILTEDLFECCY
ncbi:Transcription factor bHLH25 [Spatholobus suberectus]|nr:Transcription factor bHLH25 [Spatholobus suberectus]